MASDSLIQVAKEVGAKNKQSSETSRYISENFSLVEKSKDYLGTLYTFRMDFFTYTNTPSVRLDISFLDGFGGI